MTLDRDAGLPERNADPEPGPDTAPECHGCFDELRPGDTVSVYVNGSDLVFCASCAAERVGRDVAGILSHYGATEDYRRMRRAMEVWTEIGERLKRAVDAEGEKPACTVTQLPAPKEIAHG